MRTVLKGRSAQPRFQSNGSTQPQGSKQSSDESSTPDRFSFATLAKQLDYATPQPTAAPLKMDSTYATPSPQPSQALPLPGNDDGTGLWGIWEMWCDFPQKPHHGSKSHHSHSQGYHSSMTEKLAQVQTFTWLDSVKSLGLFDTAEGFWGIHDCTLPPSRLPNGSNYYLFRHNVAPMWEQEANRRGGKWVVQLSCDQASMLDAAWTEICVAAIGEQLPGAEEELCGVAVSKRKSGFKISLWTRNADDHDTQISIGMFIRGLLQKGATGSTSPIGQLKYLRHCETLEACSPTLNKEGSTSPIQRTMKTSPTQKSPTQTLDGSGSAFAQSMKVPEPLYTV